MIRIDFAISFVENVHIELKKMFFLFPQYGTRYKNFPSRTVPPVQVQESQTARYNGPVQGQKSHCMRPLLNALFLFHSLMSSISFSNSTKQLQVAKLSNF